MQLDSHMRVLPNWDTELIKMLHSCDAGEYSVLTSYVPSYSDDGEVLEFFPSLNVRRWHSRSESGMAHCGGDAL